MQKSPQVLSLLFVDQFPDVSVCQTVPSGFAEQPKCWTHLSSWTWGESAGTDKACRWGPG